MGRAVNAVAQPKILERLANTTNPKKRAGEAKRIELIGSLDDRHKRALAAGDRGALLELASEYLLLGCPNLSNQITIEAEGL